MKVVYPVYKPVRDYRFEYAEDALEFLEDKFCSKCIFSSGDIDYPSMGCFTGVDEILLELPVQTIVDAEENGLICTEFEGSYGQV